MKNELFTEQEIANAFASEIERRLSELQEPSAEQGNVLCSVATVRSPEMAFGDHGLIRIAAGLDPLMRFFAPQLDETAEMLTAVSSGKSPLFMSPDQLPGGLEHAAYGIAGTKAEIRLRYLRSYDMVSNQKIARIDFRVLATRWQKSISATHS